MQVWQKECSGAAVHLIRIVCLLVWAVACSDSGTDNTGNKGPAVSFGDTWSLGDSGQLKDASKVDTSKVDTNAADINKVDATKDTGQLPDAGKDTASTDAVLTDAVVATDSKQDSAGSDTTAADVGKDAAGGTDAGPAKDTGNCSPKTETCNEKDDDCDGETDESCDDGEPCTVDDTCASLQCFGQFKKCSDGDKCTADTCDGDCKFVPYNCADNNACTLDGCDPASGCTHAPTADVCDDDNPCTEVDDCSLGTCLGKPKTCDDANPCTADSCDKAAGCEHVPAGGPCDDGNACSSDDACSGGTCSGTAATICNDANACTTDSCDTSGGCTFVANTGSCEDGNACTTADSCSESTCIAGGAQICDDANPCTDDGCDVVSGCTASPNAATCDDGLGCTAGDGCQNGTCTGTPTCEAGQWCQGDGTCAACTDAGHCGASCVVCGGATPLCDGTSCVGCLGNSDCGGNAVCEAGSCKTLCPASVFAADFSAGQAGFGHKPTSNIAGDDPWAFGTPKNIGCKTGTSCFGTVLGTAGYNDCQMAELTSPVIDLTTCSAAEVPLTLRFWHYYDFEPKSSGKWWDGGTVQFSADGGASWNDVLTPTPGYQGILQGSYAGCNPKPDVGGKSAWSGVIAGKVWTEVTASIPANLRTSQFRVRWLFGADEATTSRGWFIDDVSVTSP
jgi:hypothetical protein